jgi:zinc protease
MFRNCRLVFDFVPIPQEFTSPAKMELMSFKLFLFLPLAAAALASANPQKVFPFAYTQEDLPNGLRLITIPTDYPNIVALFIVVRTGSRNEVEPGHTGFAHLFEHMMFRGTEKFPAEKYTQALARAGAASNAFTTDDFTAYHTTFSKEDLDQILMMEADRFQNLKYTEAQFKTEALAVLGEYNKNSADPASKLFEVLQDTAFEQHTYKHTTMGFLKDIEDMPNQYDYSLKFFKRYYRPDYTTIVVAGDVHPKVVRKLVDQYWGGWKRGNYQAAIPQEPPQEAPRTNLVDWPRPTLPWVVVAYHGPAYTDTAKDSAALDALGDVAFSPNSDLYQKLVIQEQKVDFLRGANEDHVDPSLFSIEARVKKPSDVDYVRDQILETVKTFADRPVSVDRLEAVKKHLRYSFSLRLDNSQAIAATAGRYVALKGTPETINRIYDLYAQITPADIQQMTRKYLTENNRTIVTLTGAAPGGKR